MIKRIMEFDFYLATASKGSPIVSTVVVMLFYLMFNSVEAAIETLIWGERFEHWLDPVFMCAFIAYAARCVYSCATFNTMIRLGGK